jgi:hypothetical protein
MVVYVGNRSSIGNPHERNKVNWSCADEQLISPSTNKISYTKTVNHLFCTKEVSSCLSVPAAAFLALANAPPDVVITQVRRANASFVRTISPLKAITPTDFKAEISIGNPLSCFACSVISSPLSPSHLVTALIKTPYSYTNSTDIPSSFGSTM